jgi:hypothetical protein
MKIWRSAGSSPVCLEFRTQIYGCQSAIFRCQAVSQQWRTREVRFHVWNTIFKPFLVLEMFLPTPKPLPTWTRGPDIKPLPLLDSASHVKPSAAQSNGLRRSSLYTRGNDRGVRRSTDADRNVAVLITMEGSSVLHAHWMLCFDTAWIKNLLE